MHRISGSGDLFRIPDTGAGLVKKIPEVSLPLDRSEDLDPLLEEIRDARYVLLGEASHGTSDFYTWRAALSQRLIREKGFSFIAVEGDWPDCYEINRYVKGYSSSVKDPEVENQAMNVLSTFERWPTWMWANWEVAAMAEWMRGHNQGAERKTGFYGLDVYSLWESMLAVMDYLQENEPEAVEAARKAYACFEPFGEDVKSYAWSTRMVPESCEDEVIELLMKIRGETRQYDQDSEADFSAEQNALVMVNAERYYRAMVRSDANSWNVRDEHMTDTLDRLMAYHGEQAKGIVWAHNSHIGDARYTDMVQGGMINIGQLARERHEDEEVMLIGFGSHRGSVIAGREWDAPMEVMQVPEGRVGSWEDYLHRAGESNKLILLNQLREDSDFMEWHGHRAIGVVYNPEYERYGNYVPTELPNRYDAFLFIDQSRALHPIGFPAAETARPPETYPWGL